MLDTLMSFLAPHHCCGCDKIGYILCPSCEYNIISEPFCLCLLCKKPVVRSNLCADCSTRINDAWVVGERKDILQRLIGDFKFERCKAAEKPLAELLDSRLPVFNHKTLYVLSIPTAPPHIRERGYDHMELICRRLCKMRGFCYIKLLERKANTKQRQASAKKRDEQAKNAFCLNNGVPFDKNASYLLIDDVMTTGATIKYATGILRKAGIKNIYVAVIAKQM